MPPHGTTPAAVITNQTKMFRSTSEAAGELERPLNRFKSPVMFYITDHSKAVLLIGLSVFACFGVSKPSVCLDDI